MVYHAYELENLNIILNRNRFSFRGYDHLFFDPLLNPNNGLRYVTLLRVLTHSLMHILNVKSF